MMDEFRFHTPEAKRGILFIRSQHNETVLAAARDRHSGAYMTIARYMGPGTNPYWITSQAAQEAYKRGLIDETELDYLAR
jgi:hypothetical protein